jgi:dTDP-4-amino-4,6-dideoxygalactose transaminase
MLKEIPGIQPVAMYEGCTRNAWHLYMFRYDAAKFAGLSRAKFMAALYAEGVPCSSGYSPLNKDPLIQHALQSRAYQKVFPSEVLKNWAERTQCPANDRLCQEAVWFVQTMLLGPRSDMEQIAAAIRKIHAHAAELAKA